MCAAPPGRHAAFADKAAYFLARATGATAIMAMGDAGSWREGPRTAAGPQSRFAASSGRRPVPRGLPRAAPTFRVPGAARPRRAPRAASRTARRPGLTHPVSRETTLHTNLSLCGDSHKNKRLPITLARLHTTSGAALAPQSAADTSHNASRTGQDTRHGSPRQGRVRRRSTKY